MSMSIKTVSGMVHAQGAVGSTVVTENLDCELSDRMSVCPRVLELKKSGKCRVPVRIFNMSAKVVEIKPKSLLCGLSEVKVLRHVDPFNESIDSVDSKKSESSCLKEEVEKLG